MLKKIKTLAILILMGVIAFLLFQGSTFLDSKLENKPSQWVQDKPVIAPVTKTPEEATVAEAIAHVAEQKEETKSVSLGQLTFVINANEPEISNSKYRSLRSWAKDDYPGIKDDIAAALANDGMIRQDEFMQILTFSNAFSEAMEKGAKDELKEFLNER